MSEITITIDLHADLKEIVLNQFPVWSFEIPATNDLYHALTLFYNLMKRVVFPKPRRVVKSREFTCPVGLKQGLQFLESKITAGKNINGHLSREILKLDYRDALLNDWGIQHLHLGTKPDPKGRPLIEGTSNLLYAYFDDDAAYLIQILDHDSFAEQGLLQIIHENWPQVLEQYRLLDDVSLIHSLSASERKLARKAGITAAVEMKDGTVYCPPGGGIMTDGTSLTVLRQADRTLDLLDEVTHYIKQQTGSWPERLETDARVLHFQLTLAEDNQFCIVELITGKSIVQFDQSFGHYKLMLDER